MIYADHAATTKLDDDALEAMLPWMKEEYGNASQPYSFSRKPKKAIANARAEIAACIGACPEEIFFTSGGTESDNWAIKGIIGSDKPAKMITSQVEHHAILRACEVMGKYGCNVRYLPVNQYGEVLPETLLQEMDSRVSLVSIMLANNEIGTIEPVAALASIAHESGVPFHTDAVQAVGHIPVDVNLLGVDMLSASAHKFNGPKGAGFLYVKKGTNLQPWHNGGSQESGMRAGTENVAGIVGMAVALKKNCDRMAEADQKLRSMEKVFFSVLRKEQIDFIRNGSDNTLPGNISISIRNANGEMLLHRLDLKGIAISTGSACDSVNTQVSHVIKAIGTPREYQEGTIRISFGFDNNPEDAATIAKAICSILKK